MHYTGHALVDVGLAGLCAFAGCPRPEELSLADLDEAADFMEQHYYQDELLCYLSCTHMNASFAQSSHKGPNNPARQPFVDQYLRAHRASPHALVKGLECTFTGQPAIAPLFRSHLPMFSGEGVMNWCPAGRTFVPAAGWVTVALMFLPMAGRRAEGRLLLVHGDEPDWTLRFASKYVEDHRRLLTVPFPTEKTAVHPGYERELPMFDGSKAKFPDVKRWKSFVLADLLTMLAPGQAPAGLTIYWISNGQKPAFERVVVPPAVCSFLSTVKSMPAWPELASRFWPLSSGTGETGRKKKAHDATPGRAGWTGNPVFEDLLEIFRKGNLDRGAAFTWIKKHVQDRDVAEVFATEVLGMKKERIALAREFGTRLGFYIAEKRDKKLFYAMTKGNIQQFQSRLRQAQSDSAANGTLLFGFDEHVNLWQHPDNDAFSQWSLVRVRAVEVLKERGWFGDPENLKEVPLALDSVEEVD